MYVMFENLSLRRVYTCNVITTLKNYVITLLTLRNYTYMKHLYEIRNYIYYNRCMYTFIIYVVVCFELIAITCTLIGKV
jgi:hypothetical protein